MMPFGGIRGMRGMNPLDDGCGECMSMQEMMGTMGGYGGGMMGRGTIGMRALNAGARDMGPIGVQGPGSIYGTGFSDRGALLGRAASGLIRGATNPGLGMSPRHAGSLVGLQQGMGRSLPGGNVAGDNSRSNFGMGATRIGSVGSMGTMGNMQPGVHGGGFAFGLGGGRSMGARVMGPSLR